MTIFTKDDRRGYVEASSGGAVTVMYTAAGHPCYMVRVPKFNLEDIDPSLGTGVHPAFIVNGIEKDEIFIGQYPGIVKDGNLLSIPNVPPSVSANFDTFRGWAAANGPGWHLMTHAEWAAIALWCWKNDTMPRGNNDYGRDIGCKWETAPRVDGGTLGERVGNGRSYTGAGPVSWRHNHQANGIADLNGNVWEWASGMRLNNGEIQILANNDAADNTKDLSSGSSLWRAIKASDGSLVAPGTAGTLKYDSSGASSGSPVLSDTIANPTGDSDDNGNGNFDISVELQSMTEGNGITAPSIAKALGLFPVDGSMGGDRIYVRNHGERLPLAGGYYNFGVSAGVFARHLYYARTYVYYYVGARPAFIF